MHYLYNMVYIYICEYDTHTDIHNYIIHILIIDRYDPTETNRELRVDILQFAKLIKRLSQVEGDFYCCRIYVYIQYIHAIYTLLYIYIIYIQTYTRSAEKTFDEIVLDEPLLLARTHSLSSILDTYIIYIYVHMYNIYYILTKIDLLR